MTIMHFAYGKVTQLLSGSLERSEQEFKMRKNYILLYVKVWVGPVAQPGRAPGS